MLSGALLLYMAFGDIKIEYIKLVIWLSFS